MMDKLNLWLSATRLYALPMSIFSWFVAFCFGVTKSGNTIYGIIALLGICCVHIGANMFDDFIDYNLLKKEIKDGKTILLNTQKGKCEYLLNSSISIKQLLIAITLAFSIAIGIGLFLTIKTGLSVLIFMGLGGIIGLLYPILGKFRLCELAIAIIYGPLMFGGVDYVMAGHYDWHTLIICIPSMIMTVNMLYTDTMLDYDIDREENKKTLANLFPTKWDALFFHKILIGTAYLSVILIAIFDISDWQVFMTLTSIPLAVNLIDSMKIFIIDNEEVPSRKAYEGPMENWNQIMEEGSATFMLRMYQARNLMMFFTLILGISLLFDA